MDERANAKRLRAYLRSEAAIKVDQLLEHALPALEEAQRVDPNLNVWRWADEWLGNQIGTGKVMRGELDGS